MSEAAETAVVTPVPPSNSSPSVARLIESDPLSPVISRVAPSVTDEADVIRPC